MALAGAGAGAGTTRLVQSPSVQIDGQDLPAEFDMKMLDLRLSQTVGAASRFEIRFRDRDFTMIDDTMFSVGKRLWLGFPPIGNGSTTWVFKGEIVAIATDFDETAIPMLVVEALDRSHRLSQSSRIRTFVKMKHSDIVNKIAAEAGLSAKVDATSVQFDYLLQSGTDHAMLDEIALRTGMEWFVTDETLTFRKRVKRTVVATTTYGVDLIKFRARVSAVGRTAETSVRGWDPLTKQKIIGKNTTSSDGGSPPQGVVSMRNDSNNLGSSTKSLVTRTVHVESTAEANELATALANRSAGQELSARGEMFGSPVVAAGTWITVDGVGDRLRGDYYLNTVEHVFSPTKGYICRFSAGGPQRENLVDVLGGPQSAVAQWAGRGFVIGIVTNIADDKKLNRVKVRYPAFSDADESDWARIVQPMSGAEFGWVAMPAVNDEVLVGFENGDVRRPYVFGSLYNGKDKPPYLATEGNAHLRGLKTKSGHQMIFNDEGGKESITLHHGNQKDSKVVIEEKKVQVWVGGSETIELKAGQATIVLSKDNITIKGQKVEIEAQTGLSIKSKTDVKIEASTTLDAKATTAASLTANGKVEVVASAMLKLKGATTMIN